MGRITMRKIGDVVECKGQLSFTTQEGEKGVIIMECVEDLPPDYVVYWFNSETELVYREDLRQCKGMRSRKLCNACEHSLICPHLQEIARCDVSEFGQMRGEGKYDSDICIQRKCKHTGVCLTNRWLR